MPRAHPWNRQPIWARNEPATCRTCQAPFMRHHIRQIYCNQKCWYQKNTIEDKKLFERFDAICAKLNLNKHKLYIQLFYDRGVYYVLKNQKPTTRSIGKDKKQRLMMSIKAFCDQVEKGYWQIVPCKETTVAVRLMKPQEKHCPRQVPGCQGHFLPHYCPRNFKECSLS